MKDIERKVLAEAQAQICGLLLEEWPNIIDARNAAAIEASKQLKDKFSYPVTLKVLQEPKGSEVNVSSKIAYTVAHNNETDVATVDDHPQLPGMGEGAE